MTPTGYQFELKGDSTPEQECDSTIKLEMDFPAARELVTKLDRALTAEETSKVSVVVAGNLVWNDGP